jgi:hypothetical protein
LLSSQLDGLDLLAEEISPLVRNLTVTAEHATSAKSPVLVPVVLERYHTTQDTDQEALVHYKNIFG